MQEYIKLPEHFTSGETLRNCHFVRGYSARGAGACLLRMRIAKPSRSRVSPSLLLELSDLRSSALAASISGQSYAAKAV